MYYVLHNILYPTEIRISFDVEHSSLREAMVAVAAVHNYATPMIIYDSDMRDDGKYVRGDIAQSDEGRVSMEKLAHDLIKKKLVGTHSPLQL